MLKNSIPQRRCIGCMVSQNQNQLIRMTYDGTHIAIDREGRASGRGFYLCKNVECLDKAIKRKSFNRIIKGPANEEDLMTIKNLIGE